jgi:C1A family cysteine protease
MYQPNGFGMGWVPDFPDFRDYHVDHGEIAPRLKQLGQSDSLKKMFAQMGATKVAKLSLPSAIDLRQWCSPIESQGGLGSCTAHAGIGLVEYFERRAFDKHIDASRLFLYKATRNLAHWTGDTGAHLRTTMAAMVLFGVPPEEYWPYEISDFDKEPPAFCYAFAQNYQALNYYRLDTPGLSRDDLLARIKTNLAAQLPSMFGFTVYNSISQAANNGEIPFPTAGEKAIGGHAVMAVGYDDKVKTKNANPGGIEYRGALLVRNSWGLDWGRNGYGWLPYEYVLKHLAVDWWSLLKSEWVDTGRFKL